MYSVYLILTFNKDKYLINSIFFYISMFEKKYINNRRIIIDNIKKKKLLTRYSKFKWTIKSLIEFCYF